VVPVVSRVARDHRLPYVTPSGVENVAARDDLVLAYSEVELVCG